MGGRWICEEGESPHSRRGGGRPMCVLHCRCCCKHLKYLKCLECLESGTACKKGTWRQPRKGDSAQGSRGKERPQCPFPRRAGKVRCETGPGDRPHLFRGSLHTSWLPLPICPSRLVLFLLACTQCTKFLGCLLPLAASHHDVSNDSPYQYHSGLWTLHRLRGCIARALA